MVRYVLPALVLALAACSDPPTPDKEQPPEPKAAAQAREHDDVARAVQRPLDRAREAQAAVDASVARQRDVLDAVDAGADAAETAAP